MYWKKLGKIFDPTEHGLPNGCVEFAQSPQTLVFDDFVRIYFSTRKVDGNGKFISHIAYVDMSPDLQKIVGISDETVVELGGLGEFDEHGIFPINVVRHEGRILAYTCGWSRRVSTSVETGVGFAESFDEGKSFTKLGKGPIMGASLDEPFLVGDAFVKYYEGVFHMWYMFGTKWASFDGVSPPDRVYKIGHATSEDGVNWIKEEGKQVISDKLHENESMALPTVVMIGERYHMYFCYRESSDFRKNKNRGYRIGYAFSDDLKDWTRDDALVGVSPTDVGWDSDMMCYPHVFENNGRVFLLYNGNEFGRYGFGACELVQ